jgi:hypothetical protein
MKEKMLIQPLEKLTNNNPNLPHTYRTKIQGLIFNVQNLIMMPHIPLKGQLSYVMLV